MNAPLLVTAAVCVGAPTLLAAALLYRERIRPTDQRLDQLADDEHGEHQIVDSEDHGHEPTDIEQQIIDNLRSTPMPEVDEAMRDRAMERFRARCLGDLETHAPRVEVTITANAETLLAEIQRVWDLSGELVNAPADNRVFTADELDEQVAAYETAAAERFRHAGVTWPTNPASVGIARYDSKAGK